MLTYQGLSFISATAIALLTQRGIGKARSKDIRDMLDAINLAGQRIKANISTNIRRH
jgi:hypothetical protein